MSGPVVALVGLANASRTLAHVEDFFLVNIYIYIYMGFRMHCSLLFVQHFSLNPADWRMPSEFINTHSRDNETKRMHTTDITNTWK